MVFVIRSIIEVLGYPEEHVNAVTENVVKKLKSENGIQVLKENVNKAEKVKDTIHASMIEVELKINDYSKLINFCYDYLPSSIEVIDTEKIAVSAREFTNGLNDMLVKLHQYNLTTNNILTQLEKTKNQIPTSFKVNEAQKEPVNENEIDLTK